MEQYKLNAELFGEYSEIVVNLINVNVHKIGKNIGGVRLIAARFKIIIFLKQQQTSKLILV